MGINVRVCNTSFSVNSLLDGFIDDVARGEAWGGSAPKGKRNKFS